MYVRYIPHRSGTLQRCYKDFTENHMESFSTLLQQKEYHFLYMYWSYIPTDIISTKQLIKNILIMYNLFV